ncbi:hypothetical protein KIPB_004078 [Kipferlia bialata]|uniref:Uncharacterized protein n=1 Tax=Kipferlia bialata TaxID=797122 RepID=A0A9K3GGA4_9EUKA|nr:hypothetical protein KIPB_004078 [Kipferlia bialata]|eukprot:g4078.t1
MHSVCVPSEGGMGQQSHLEQLVALQHRGDECLKSLVGLIRQPPTPDILFNKDASKAIKELGAWSYSRLEQTLSKVGTMSPFLHGSAKVLTSLESVRTTLVECFQWLQDGIGALSELMGTNIARLSLSLNREVSLLVSGVISRLIGLALIVPTVPNVKAILGAVCCAQRRLQRQASDQEALNGMVQLTDKLCRSKFRTVHALFTPLTFLCASLLDSLVGIQSASSGAHIGTGFSGRDTSRASVLPFTLDSGLAPPLVGNSILYSGSLAAAVSLSPSSSDRQRDGYKTLLGVCLSDNLSLTSYLSSLRSLVWLCTAACPSLLANKDRLGLVVGIARHYPEQSLLPETLVSHGTEESASVSVSEGLLFGATQYLRCLSVFKAASSSSFSTSQARRLVSSAYTEYQTVGLGEKQVRVSLLAESLRRYTALCRSKLPAASPVSLLLIAHCALLSGEIRDYECTKVTSANSHSAYDELEVSVNSAVLALEGCRRLLDTKGSPIRVWLDGVSARLVRVMCTRLSADTRTGRRTDRHESVLATLESVTETLNGSTAQTPEGERETFLSVRSALDEIEIALSGLRGAVSMDQFRPELAMLATVRHCQCLSRSLGSDGTVPLVASYTLHSGVCSLPVSARQLCRINRSSTTGKERGGDRDVYGLPPPMAALVCPQVAGTLNGVAEDDKEKELSGIPLPSRYLVSQHIPSRIASTHATKVLKRNISGTETDSPTSSPSLERERESLEERERVITHYAQTLEALVEAVGTDTGSIVLDPVSLTLTLSTGKRHLSRKATKQLGYACDMLSPENLRALSHLDALSLSSSTEGESERVGPLMSSVHALLAKTRSAASETVTKVLSSHPGSFKPSGPHTKDTRVTPFADLNDALVHSEGIELVDVCSALAKLSVASLLCRKISHAHASLSAQPFIDTVTAPDSAKDTHVEGDSVATLLSVLALRSQLSQAGALTVRLPDTHNRMGLAMP